MTPPRRARRIRKLTRELEAAIRELQEVIEQMREVGEPAAEPQVAAYSEGGEPEEEDDTP